MAHAVVVLTAGVPLVRTPMSGMNADARALGVQTVVWSRKDSTAKARTQSQQGTGDPDIAEGGKGPDGEGACTKSCNLLGFEVESIG